MMGLDFFKAGVLRGAAVTMVAVAGICPGLVSCAGSGGDFTRKEVVYTPEGWPVELGGSVFRPVGEGRAPAVLLIHGGVKLGEDGRWLMGGTARRLARRGYYVLNITYRSINRWSYPAQLEDVRAALGWMGERAGEEGIDVERLAVFGYSAGGYLGALAALDRGEREMPEVNCVVAGAAPTDLSVYRRGRLARRYFNSGGEPTEWQLIEASPLSHVREESPPVFIYHNTDDDLVRPDHALKFVRVLEYHGVPHELFWIRGGGHVTGFFRSGEAVEKAVDFLDRYLKPDQ